MAIKRKLVLQAISNAVSYEEGHAKPAAHALMFVHPGEQRNAVMLGQLTAAWNRQLKAGHHWMQVPPV